MTFRFLYCITPIILLFTLGFDPLYRSVQAVDTESTRNIRQWWNQHQRNKIIDGEEAVPGRYPYQVTLFKQSGGIGCGGSLIHPEWVLTAAHCENHYTQVRISHYNISDMSETFESHETEIEVRHPNYNPSTINNDIMLLKLKTPSNYTPVQIDDGSIELLVGTNVTVMGFGMVSMRTFGKSEILLETDVNLVSNEACDQKWDFRNISDTKICAIGDGNGPLRGDSGGPLIIRGENASMDVQVGIVSWGQICGRTNKKSFPDVYERVRSHQEFINSTMSCTIPNDTNFENCCEVRCEGGVFSCIQQGFPDDGFDYSNCNADQFCSVGNGHCKGETEYDNAECNYDGGDCCEETCTDGSLPCGIGGYNCIDPDFEERNIIEDLIMRVVEFAQNLLLLWIFG